MTTSMGVLALLGACAAPLPAPESSESPASFGVGPGATRTRAEQTIEAPTHDVGARDGSRMYLLELYQKAMDQKDALGLEVNGLHAELERREAERAKLERERDGLASQVQALTTERDGLKSETFELAQRLVTAQIRRLEAEKILLETLLENQRREDEAATAEASSEHRGSRAAAVTPAHEAAGRSKVDVHEPAPKEHHE